MSTNKLSNGSLVYQDDDGNLYEFTFSQEELFAHRETIVLQGEAGAWYAIPATELERFRVPEADVERLKAALPPVDEAQGYVYTGTQTNTSQSGGHTYSSFSDGVYYVAYKLFWS